eukprot:6074620-Prymnesium_polylepis.2
MSDRAQGLGDLAGEVVSHLAQSLNANDDRRPWLVGDMMRGSTPTGPLRMGIQHFEGRATWVLKLGKDGEREIRFALSDENIAVNLFFKAIRFNGNCSVRIVHGSQILMTVNVSAKDVKEFQDLDCDVKHLIGIVKSAI